MSYWFHAGNNQNFLLLLSQMAHAELCCEIVDTADNQSDLKNVATAQEFLEPATDFFDSFAGEAADIWDLVSSPFRKETKEDIQGFLANDDEEEEEDDAPEFSHRAFNVRSEMASFQKSQDEDQKRVERFQYLAEREGEEVAIDSGEDDEDDEDESEEDVKNGGRFEELSSEEDEWEKEIETKRLAKRKSLSPQKRPSPARRVTMSYARTASKKQKDAFEGTDEESSGDEEEKSPVAPASSMQKRLVIQDDDSD